MILTNKEKDRIVQSLSWMIEDMKHRHDQLKGNLEEGSQGDYSVALKEAMVLLQDVKKVDTIEVTGCHRNSSLVNCREFACVSNRQGICASAKVTLESMGIVPIGKLRCVEAEKFNDSEEEG